MNFSIVVAATTDLGIGYKGSLPWRIPVDMAHFKSLTTGSAVIMGRKTWESIPIQHRPLAQRLNIVLTRNQEKRTLEESVVVARSLEEALQFSSSFSSVFVIGGSELYREAMEHPQCEKIYMTKVESICNVDTFFPAIPRDKFRLTYESEKLKEEKAGISFWFQEYEKSFS